MVNNLACRVVCGCAALVRSPAPARGPGTSDRTDGAGIRLGSDSLTDRRQTRFLTSNSVPTSTSGQFYKRASALGAFVD